VTFRLTVENFFCAIDCQVQVKHGRARASNDSIVTAASSAVRSLSAVRCASGGVEHLSSQRSAPQVAHVVEALVDGSETVLNLSGFY
jgi:hypothetical protein